MSSTGVSSHPLLPQECEHTAAGSRQGKLGLLRVHIKSLHGAGQQQGQHRHFFVCEHTRHALGACLRASGGASFVTVNLLASIDQISLLPC